MAKKAEKRNPVATILVAIGIIALICAAGWYVRNLLEDIKAEQASRDVVKELTAYVVEEADEGAGKTDESAGVVDDLVDPTTDENLLEMERVAVNGSYYIGLIELPSAGLTLPVCYDWDYSKLAVSQCRYCGSYFTDDMVICAHDYGSHFRAIRSLGIGDEVFFSSVSGNRIKYIVTNVETVQPTEIEKMTDNRKAGGEETLWDMTLFTCNIGGQTRCAVRLERTDK